MAEWIMCLTTDQEIPGSSPGRVDKIFFFGSTEFRSLNLSLAKRALYRLSYTPFMFNTLLFEVYNPLAYFTKTFQNVFIQDSLLRMRSALRMRTAQGQTFCPTSASGDFYPHI